MKVIVLSSGSKGNTTYIETNKTKLLIDAGNSCKYVTDKLKSIDVNIADLDGIILTHTHVDHINGLKTIVKKYNINIYLTEKMLNSLKYVTNYTLIEEDNLYIGDLKINVIKTSHDAEDSRGYVVSDLKTSLVYITDTGYINRKYYDLLSNRDIYIMESNHDIEMLNNSSYPFNLRQRILSDKGHLSNYDSSKYLSSFIGDKTKYILLAHLSEENNTEELAYEELHNKLKELGKTEPKIIVATQNKETELIEI